MSYLRAFALSIRQLVNTWTAVDRIRISPTEGRLLNLTVGQKILIQDQLYLITCRDARSETHQIRIVYHLRYAGVQGTLSVRSCCQSGKTTGQLRCGNQTRIVFDSDVVVCQAACTLW